MPSSAEIWTSRNWLPGGNVPSRMALRTARKASEAVVDCCRRSMGTLSPNILHCRHSRVYVFMVDQVPRALSPGEANVRCRRLGLVHGGRSGVGPCAADRADGPG